MLAIFKLFSETDLANRLCMVYILEFLIRA